MNSKNCPLRSAGQRLITSTFLFRASNGSRNVETKAPSQKGSRFSLSDFLNNKLHRGSVLPSSVQGKDLPFSSPLRGENLDRGAEGRSGKRGGGEAEAKFSIDGALDLFKNIKKEKNDSMNSCSTNETHIFGKEELKQTRKRRSIFEGDDNEKPASRKRLVVLGEDSKPVQCSRKKAFATDEPTPLFNHYTNGGGWWNDNMEGVDNEEVGCTESWEGVGCTTLGGIEWH